VVFTRELGRGSGGAKLNRKTNTQMPDHAASVRIMIQQHRVVWICGAQHFSSFDGRKTSRAMTWRERGEDEMESWSLSPRETMID
jgi:hypothetical protein